MMVRQQMIILLVLGSLFMTCPFAWLVPLSSNPSDQGTLEVDINYTGHWYRDTFDYARDAENIRHVVLVRPVSEGVPDDAGWIFTSLVPQEDGSWTVREDRQEYAFALPFIYDAPQGYFHGEFEPGQYAIAAAFIASPLSRDDAEAGEDAVLWAGVTGGGASTDYQFVTLEAGETTSLTIPITDGNGWACPWLYVADGDGFERRFEILRNVRGADHEQTEITPLGVAQDGVLTIRIAEEKAEITYLDALYLEVDGVAIYAENPQLAADDGGYVILHQGEFVDLRFLVPDNVGAVSIVANGYYAPLD